MSDLDGSRRLANWFRQWRAPLRKFIRGRTAVPDAELDDVAQEVFLRLMRYDRAELILHPQAYLYKMALNVAAEWSIRSRHTCAHDSRWLTNLVVEDESAKGVAREAADREVRRAIEALGARQRQMLKLHFAEGLHYAEIAERLGTTRRSVKRVLIQSYEKLRQELDPDLLE